MMFYQIETERFEVIFKDEMPGMITVVDNASEDRKVMIIDLASAGGLVTAIEELVYVINKDDQRDLSIKQYLDIPEPKRTVRGKPYPFKNCSVGDYFTVDLDDMGKVDIAMTRRKVRGERWVRRIVDGKINVYRVE